LVLNQWTHFMMSVASTGEIDLLVNGVSAGVNSASFSDVQRDTSYLGRSNWQDAYFTGKMDEVHVSKRARPAGWAKLSYETQKRAANSVLTFGATGVPASIGPASQARARLMRVNPQGRGYLFSLPAAAAADMRLSVLDMHGRVVWSSVMAAGSSAVEWKGLAATGRPLARGMYFARLAPLSGGLSSVWEARFAHTK
jgi:hypothetical protein